MRAASIPIAFALAGVLAACGPSSGAHSSLSPLADKWYMRAKTAYRTGDFEDAHNSAAAALQAAPQDNDVRILSARIALSRLEYADALKLTNGLAGSEVHAIRGRAHWYAGDTEAAADELDAMLTDPEVKDPWAREVAALARQGQGRHPFAIEGAVVAAVEMPPAGPALIVPCELEGEQIFALVATAIGEVVIDSNSRHEPAWVNMRFGDRLEVKDVPALTQDLSGMSRQLGVPIRALLGVNFLRHAHVTFDRLGDQFVVRRSDSAPPPDASRIPLWYVRGGGMLMQASVSNKDDGVATLLVDTAAFLPLALEDATWRRAGIDPSSLVADPQVSGMKTGVVPFLRIGAMELARVPALEGTGEHDAKAALDIDLGGVVGASLLAQFRVTFGDDGRFMWLEADPTMGGLREHQPGAQPVEPSAPPPAASSKPALTAPKKAP